MKRHETIDEKITECIKEQAKTRSQAVDQKLKLAIARLKHARTLIGLAEQTLAWAKKNRNPSATRRWEVVARSSDGFTALLN